MTELDDIKGFYTKAAYVGSRVTCDPAPLNTDLDILVLCEPELYMIIESLLTHNHWSIDGSLPSDQTRFELLLTESFNSYKLNSVNIILTPSEKFYDKFLLATEVSKALNLMRKDHRIILFQSILYGNAPL